MPNVIFTEDEKIETMVSVCVTDVIDRENGNYCMYTVAINTEVNTENNLQLKFFRSFFKLFRVMALVYKLVEKLEHKVKIKTKQVENKIEKNITDINLDIINIEDIHAASNLWLCHIKCAFHSKKYDDLAKKLEYFYC